MHVANTAATFESLLKLVQLFSISSNQSCMMTWFCTDRCFHGDISRLMLVIFHPTPFADSFIPAVLELGWEREWLWSCGVLQRSAVVGMLFCPITCTL